MASYTMMLLISLSYQVGYMTHRYTEQEYICDCEKTQHLDVVDQINYQLLADNVRLYKELYISLEYMNYTNLGNVYYKTQTSSEVTDLVILPLETFINEFYEFKTNIYVSIKKLIESKRLLYQQYIEIKHRC